MIAVMQQEGLTKVEATERLFMLNRRGLLLDNDPELLDFQKGLATDPARVQDWVLRHSEPPNTISLLDVVTNAKPTVLIGVSGQPGLFRSEEHTSELQSRGH